MYFVVQQNEEVLSWKINYIKEGIIEVNKRCVPVHKKKNSAKLSAKLNL